MKEQSGIPYRATFARLLGFLRPYKVSVVVSIVLAVGSQVAQIALVWVTKNVIDEAIAPHDTEKLWVFVATIVVLGNGVAELDARRVYVLVPGEGLDVLI